MQNQLQFDLRQRLDECLHTLLVRNAGPWPLERAQKCFLRILSDRRGAARAMPITDIVGVMRLDDHKVDARSVKQIAADLTVCFKVPIGASRVQPYGYFLIETLDELQSTSQIYAHEIQKLAQRYRALNGASAVSSLFGQLELELAKEPEHV